MNGGKRDTAGRPAKLSAEKREAIGRECEEVANHLQQSADLTHLRSYLGPELHDATRSIQRAKETGDTDEVIRLQNIVARETAALPITFNEYKRRYALPPKGRAAIVRAVAAKHNLREREVWNYWRLYRELSNAHREPRGKRHL